MENVETNIENNGASLEQFIAILSTIEHGEEINKQFDQHLRKFKSVVEIDKDNIKISKINGALEKTRNNIMKKYAIPELQRKQDIYRVIVVDDGTGRLLGVKEEDLDAYLIYRNIPNNDGAINTIYFYTEERMKWRDDILQPKQRKILRRTIFQSLQKLRLSYGLYSWLETYILYGEETEIDSLTYDWAITEIFDMFQALKDRYFLVTGEKKALLDTARIFRFMNRDGKCVRFDLKNIIKIIDTLPQRKERKKRMLDTAIEANRLFGTIDIFDDPATDIIERTKITDKILVDRLYSEENNISSERIKKLRQRYKSKLKN